MINENYKKLKSNPYVSNNRYLSQSEIDFSMKFNSKDFIKDKNTHSNLSIINNGENLNQNPYKYFTDFSDIDKNKIDPKNINDNKQEKKFNTITNRNKNNNKLLPIIYKSEDKGKENYLIRKNYSQIDMINNNNNLNISNVNNINNSYVKKNNDLSKFVGELKIINFYSTSEIILLIENIINELNLKKEYSFSVKDSFMSFIFNDAEEALTIFKRINIEKLKNNYYRNLSVDIHFEIRGHNEIKEEINESAKNRKKNVKKIKIKKLSLKPIKSKNKNINLNNNKIGKFKNLKTYNYSKDNIIPNNISNKYFEGIYKNYQEYFNQRKEERRKKELNYINGKDISLLASSPFVENSNIKSFQQHLRKYDGNDVGPAKFNGYIDRASNKIDNYKESHLYEVPDFINHWKLREENKKKWISPAQFLI